MTQVPSSSLAARAMLVRIPARRCAKAGYHPGRCSTTSRPAMRASCAGGPLSQGDIRDADALTRHASMTHNIARCCTSRLQPMSASRSSTPEILRQQCRRVAVAAKGHVGGWLPQASCSPAPAPSTVSRRGSHSRGGAEEAGQSLWRLKAHGRADAFVTTSAPMDFESIALRYFNARWRRSRRRDRRAARSRDPSDPASDDGHPRLLRRFRRVRHRLRHTRRHRD